MRCPQFTWVLAALAVGACGWLDDGAGNTGPAELDHSRFRPIVLDGHVLPGSEALALPWRVDLAEGHLVVIDLGLDPAAHLLDERDGTLIRAFGRKGEGPGEFASPWSIDPTPEVEGEVWIYDLGLSRVTRLPLDAADSEDGDSPAESIRLLGGTTVLDPIWADTLFVAVGFFESGRLGLFDRGGRLLRTVGDPPPGDAEIPVHLRQHAYQGSLAASPSRTRLVVGSRHADRLEIYAPDGTLLALAEPPFGFSPSYSVRESGGEPALATDRDVRFGYIDLAATESRIYALFSGRTRWGFPGEANFAEYVHVYDWEGRLVEVYKLDAAAIALAVGDGPLGELYTIRHVPAPAIIRYLPPS